MLPRVSRLSLALLLLPLLSLAPVAAEEPPAEAEPLLQVEGALEDSDPVLPEDNTRYDEYQFEGQAGQTITIVLESVEFDTYVLLKDSAGQTVGQNDDYEDGNRNSAITFTLPESGTYTIVANAYGETSRGEYRLTVLAGSEPVFLAAEEQIQKLEQQLAAHRAAGDRENEAIILYRIGEAYKEQQQYPQAIAAFQQAFEICLAIGNRSGQAETLNQIGIAYYKKQEYDQAISYFEQSLALHQQIQSIQDVRQVLVNLAGTYEKLEQFNQAEKLYKQAIEVAQQLDDPSVEISTLYSLGLMYNGRGQSLNLRGINLESIPAFEQAIEVFQQVQRYAQAHEEIEIERDAISLLLGTRRSIGYALRDEQNYAEAIVIFQQVLDDLYSYQNRLSDSEYIEERKDTLIGLGATYVELAQYAEALPRYQELVQIAEQLDDYQSQLQSLQMVVASYRNLGDYDQALKVSQQMLTMVREKLPEDREAESSALTWLGMIYDDLGQYSAALEKYRLSLLISRELNDTGSEISLLNNIGIVYFNQGQYLQAVAPLEKGLEINKAAIQQLQDKGMAAVSQLCGEGLVILQADGYQSCLERFQTQSVNLLNGLATVYKELSRFPEATSAYEQALAIAEQYGEIHSQMFLLNGIGLLYDSLGKYSKALEKLQQSFQISLQTQNKPFQTVALNNIGFMYADQGQYPKALEYCQNSLVLSREINAPRSEASALSCIASVYESQGRLTDALITYQQSLDIEKSLGGNVATSLNNIALIYANQGSFDKALEYFEQSLEIARETGARINEAITLSNIAILYSEQADYSKALTLSTQSLELRQKFGNLKEQISGLTLTGGLNIKIGQYTQALSSYEQALELSRSINSQPEQAEALAGIAKTYLAQEEYTQALKFYQQALALVQQMGDVFFESRIQQAVGFIYLRQGKAAEASELLEQALKTQNEIGVRPDVGRTLNRLGLTYADQGKTSEAINALQQAIAIHREVGDRAAEAEALANLGQVFAQQNQPEVAIAFYKQSINLTEQIRQGLQTLARDQQESYADTVTNRYRTLADLLIAQGRFLEAEQVIELLRLQEVYEYSRSTVLASGEIVFTPTEENVIRLHQSLIAFAKVFAECNAQATCNQEIYDQQIQLNQEWNKVIDELNAAAAARERRADDETAVRLSDLSSNGSKIVAAQPNTVMIYPVVQDNRLSILWIMPGGMSNAIQVEVDQKEIAIAVSQFRELMKACEVNGCTREADIEAIQAVSQRLYQWLMPSQLKAELEQNGITNLVFALDRFLRYIPMAALYDGEQYLIESYSISTVTVGPSQSNPLPAADQISVLGLGLSESVPADPGRGIPQPFSPLDNVPIELAAIVEDQTDSSSNGAGVFRGRELLNPDFDRMALRLATQYPILHIATHGSFDPINEFNSFLVLGTKEALTISEIKNYGVATFGNLSLVVLSACETALGEAERYQDGVIPDGREVTSIAQTFIDAGADTIVASLWQVNDPATAALMQQFYASLAASRPDKPVTIAQALQQAQLRILRGQITEGSLATRADIIPGGVAVTPSSEAASRRYAHPYYWSAFTVIGGGL